MAIRYTQRRLEGLGGKLSSTPDSFASTPQARGINPNVSYVKKQTYTPAKKEPGKTPKWRKDLIQSYKKLGIKPPSYIRKTRQQREQAIIDASVGTGTDNDPKPAIADASGDNYFEICRKVSVAIITQDNEYELPPNWPTEGFGNDLPDPDEPWLQVERVHEIVYIKEESKEIKREKFYVLIGESDGEVDSIAMVVVLATPNDPALPAGSRISTALYNSTEAQAAIAQAGTEV